VTEIVKALCKLDEAAAKKFVELYLKESWEDEAYDSAQVRQLDGRVNHTSNSKTAV